MASFRQVSELAGPAGRAAAPRRLAMAAEHSHAQGARTSITNPCRLGAAGIQPPRRWHDEGPSVWVEGPSHRVVIRGYLS